LECRRSLGRGAAEFRFESNRNLDQSVALILCEQSLLDCGKPSLILGLCA
jgi:hypothetical protein